MNLRLADYIPRGARTKPAAARSTTPTVARPDPNPIATDLVPRSVKLSAKDAEKYEYTAGCPGCVYAAAGMGGSRAHSAACRNLMEERLAPDADGKRRLREAGECTDLWVAEKVEVDVANAAVFEVQEMPKKDPEVSGSLKAKERKPFG